MPIDIGSIHIERSRDALLTDFGKKTLEDRYLLPGESYQDMFARVAATYASDEAHGQRIYNYISRLWFMPATPILSNGGAGRGLPISCFLNQAGDSLSGIQDTWNENTWLASNGGGIGTYWGGVRSIGEKVGIAGTTSGIIPFIRVMDSLTLAIAQGSLRRGSAAVYLDIHHPEIEEFLEIRKPSGDFNRKSLNLHHGVNITDEFMNAVYNDLPFDLRSPKTGETIRTVSARNLWIKLLDIRMQTGEPYMVFTDTANRSMAKHQRDLGMRVSQSNLCAEIMLHTGKDHLEKERTAVCCLSSVNAEKFYEWKEDEFFVQDIMRFLDNVIQDFIDNAPDTMEKARYAAMRERSVGLGVMGFHSLLQQKGLPFNSLQARNLNMMIFSHLRHKADEASHNLAQLLGPCPDAADMGVMERFSHKLAVAPTASISIICGGTSAGIEPIPANIYTHKTLSGSFVVKNKYLQRELALIGKDIDAVWNSILENEGSVQHLDFLSDSIRDIYRTARELNQMDIIQMAADRAPSICQAQSVNLFVPGDVDKWTLHELHWEAWRRGVKSLYYLRSMSVQRAAHAGSGTPKMPTPEPDECLACQ